MKPVFAIDITENKHNTENNSSPFKVKTISEPTSRKLDELSGEAKDAVRQSSLPTALAIVKWIVGFTALAVGLGILKGLAKTDVVQAYKNAPALFYIVPGCAIVWIVLQLIQLARKKQTMETEQVKKMGAEWEETCRVAREELGVPEKAAPTDILIFRYKNKNGQPVPSTSGMMATPFMNIEISLYTENGALMIADNESAWAFPASELRAIRTVNKGIIIPEWHKDVGPKEGRYEQFKLSPNQYGLAVKPYHILEIEHAGETYGIYFPCYELPAFEYLTGLKAE